MNRLQLKMKMFHEGKSVIPSKFVGNGVIVPFAIPSFTMTKFKSLKKEAGMTYSEVIEELLERYGKAPSLPTEAMSWKEFKEVVEDENIDTTPHDDFKYSSAYVPKDVYEKIQSVMSTYGISRSAVIRLLVDAA